MTRQLLSTLTVAITLAYPLIIWLGQDRIQPRLLVVVLLLLSTTRLQAFDISTAWRWCVGGTLLLMACVLWTNALLPLKLYPVLVNGALFSLFAYSLVVPPSIIERWARLSEVDLSAEAISYTRRVTQVWCAFFLLNGAAALITALWGSAVMWTLYNGLIAYLLMGLLFAGEYCVRWRLKKLHRA